MFDLLATVANFNFTFCMFNASLSFVVFGVVPVLHMKHRFSIIMKSFFNHNLFFE